MMMYLFRQ